MLTSLQLRVIFWIAVGTWALILFINGQSLSVALFKPSSIVLLSITLLIGFFEKWGWRWSLLYPWFVERPNLIGTYRGEIVSHWEHPETKQRPEPIPAYLVIRQSLSTIHVRCHTIESESISMVGSFLKFDDGRLELFYTYRNEPRIEVRHRSPIHYGGVKLSIGRRADQIDGSYWTDRRTVGELHFTRLDRTTCHNFEECEALNRGELSEESGGFFQRVTSRALRLIRRSGDQD